MSPQQIMDRITQCQAALTKGNIELKTLGIKKAEAERNYRIAVAKKEVQLRKIDKYPANLVYDIARGDEIVSKLRLNRDISTIDYDVCKEALKNIRLELESYRSFLTWERVELKNT